MGAYNSNYDNLMREFKANMKTAMKQCGEVGVIRIKSETPVLSGELQSANRYESSYESCKFINDTGYAGFVELGTYKMGANPFFRRGLMNSIPEFKRVIISTMRFK